MREFQFGLGSSRARGSLEESLSEDGEMEEFVQCVPGLYERPVAPINVSFFPSVLLFPWPPSPTLRLGLVLIPPPSSSQLGTAFDAALRVFLSAVCPPSTCPAAMWPT